MKTQLLEYNLSICNRFLKDLSQKINGNTFLVSGGAGFLGSWFCDVLNHFHARKIICVDNLSSGTIKNIAHLSKSKNFVFINADSCKYTTMEKVDYIVHMASIASPRIYQKHPILTLDANVIGTRNMLELAKKQGVKSILFTSSSEVYGDAEIIPTPENYWGNVNPYGTRSCYDEAKRCGEAYCLSYYKEFNVNVRVARIFNTYGQRLDSEGYGRVIKNFIEQATSNRPITVYGDGSQTRSFNYITDTIEGLFKLLLLDDLDGEIINIGNDREITILELAYKIKKLFNSNSEIVFKPLPKDDPKRRCPDLAKANRLLNYKPKISLEEGLKI